MENTVTCLIPVYIKLEAKGSLRNHALICLPESGDLPNIKSLFEPQHEDPNERIRKLKRSDHIKMLKKIKRKNKKLKNKKTTVSYLFSTYSPFEYHT